MNNFDYIDETPKYKKKAKHKAPKKADHKHLCEPCVLETPKDWFNKPHDRSGAMNRSIAGYCPICGKLDTIKDKSLWYGKDTVFIGNLQFTESVLTEEGRRQMNPCTRTLPCFRVDDPFAKFVQLPTTE